MNAAARVALALALALVAPRVHADVQPEVMPLFGDACVPRTGPTELVVGLANPSNAPARGTLRLETLSTAYLPMVRTVPTAAFSVPPHGHATVRLQTAPSGLAAGDTVLWLMDAAGHPVSQRALRYSTPVDAMMIDATPQARLAFSLRSGTPTDPSTPPGLPAVGSALAPGVSACPALRVPQTGEVVLPRTAAGYNGVAMVVVDAGTVMSLPQDERLALADYVLTGGTLTVIPQRADELRHPTLQALLGSGIVAVTPPPVDPSGGRWMSGVQGLVPGAFPAPSTLQNVTSFTGGHLHNRALAPMFPWGAPNLLGASAEYGAGHVHVLSFDPTMPPALEDPWAVSIITRLARQAASTRATAVLRDGDDVSTVRPSIRRALDPNEGFRPGLGIAVALLLAYAVWVGPVSFALAARRRKPLRALSRLPLWAALAFAAVVGLGGFTRGFVGRARRLAIADMPAGVNRGVVRRYHGYFSGEGGAMEVSASGHDRRLYADPRSGTGYVTLDFERDGAVLRGLAVSPWTTLVVREEAMETLPGSVTLQPDTAGAIRVVNHLRVPLRDVLLIAPGATAAWAFRTIPPGATRSTTQGIAVPMATLTRVWSASYGEPAMGALPMASASSRPSGALASLFGGDAERAQQWDAVLAMAPSLASSAHAEPLLLAEIVTTPRAMSDGDLPVERDATFVRVSGWGGAL